MKNLLITYHYQNSGTNYEDCVVLQINTEVADRLIQGGQSGIGRTVLDRIIRDLSTLQGGMNGKITDIR